MEHIKNKKGFSLLELLVVISIFGFITLIGLMNYSKFNSETLLTSLAYDIALSLRQAQSYGLSVRSEVGSTDFNRGYGIYFNINDSDTSYIFFADVNKDGTYNDNPACGEEGSECIDRFTLGRGYKISDICGVPPNGTAECSSDLTFITALFKRPDPDAILSSDISGGDTYQELYVTITSPKGGVQRVFVATTGQISVGEGISAVVSGSLMADNLVVDASSVVNEDNDQIENIFIENTGVSDIFIVTMTLTWDDPNPFLLITQIDFDVLDEVWDEDGPGSPNGPQSSGTQLDIVDVFLPAGGSPLRIQEIKFDAEFIPGTTFTIVFEMSDDSEQTVSFQP